MQRGLTKNSSLNESFAAGIEIFGSCGVTSLFGIASQGIYSHRAQPWRPNDICKVWSMPRVAQLRCGDQVGHLADQIRAEGSYKPRLKRAPLKSGVQLLLFRPHKNGSMKPPSVRPNRAAGCVVRCVGRECDGSGPKIPGLDPLRHKRAPAPAARVSARLEALRAFSFAFSSRISCLKASWTPPFELAANVSDRLAD